MSTSMDSKKHIRVVSAAICNKQRYLITQRLAKAVLPLLWEFPGGRVELGESDIEALQRELNYRLGINVTVGVQISTTVQEYSSYVVELVLYQCEIEPNLSIDPQITTPQEPSPLQVQAFEWVSCDQFDDYTFTPADEASMTAIFTEEGTLKTSCS